jgi:BirA family transcriptional regulator, biotin operon repressor / biotin---[acetyl-CoA-carboxylase] ligase
MRLDIEIIRKHLTTPGATSDIRLFETVASTNEAARELAKTATPSGAVVIAEEQTAGHGRLGKPWLSPPGVNLYMSVLIRPRIPPREVAGFSFVGPLALADVVKAEGLSPTIKWPNDVLVEGKKVAGILGECATLDKRVDYVVLGFGVNLNVTREALRAALGNSAHAAGSLGEFAGREIDRNAFAAALLNHLAVWLAIYRERGPAPLLTAWRDLDILTGRRIEVRGEGPSYEGRVLGVDRDGYLLLRDSLGKRRRVLVGEIRLSD